MCRTARFFAIFFFLFTFITFLLPFQIAHAQSAYTLPDTDASVPANLHTYTQNVLLEVFSAIGCQIGGIDLTNPKEPCIGLNPQTGKLGYVQSQGGLIGMTSTMLAAMYTPPAHLNDYTRYLTSNFGLAKPTYAQGVGFQSISPLIEIWKVFRNIVYLLFVIIFVFIGFAIMLRFKIDPRTVMSIENQLPKLIIGLLLVTFSFAIAGFLIDVMWLLTFLVINILAPLSRSLPTSTVNASLFQNPFGFYNNVMTVNGSGGFLGVAFGAGGSIQQIFQNMFSPSNSSYLGLVPQHASPGCNGFDPGCWIKGAIGSALSDILEPALGFVVSWILSVLGMLVILIATLVAMFRVWFTLLLSYIYILIDIVLGPFFIIFGAIPGSKISFGAWVRDLLANLISFPTVIAVLLLGKIFMDSFTNQSGTDHLFVPPLIGNPLPQDAAGGHFGISGGNGNPLGWLIGVAIILITPSIVNTMKELLKAPQNKLGATVFQNLGMGGKAVGGLAKNVFGTLTGNDIKYDEQGRIQRVNNLPEKAWRRVAKIFGGG